MEKIGLKSLMTTRGEQKKIGHCFLHDFIVNPVPYKGRESLGKNEESDDHYRYTNPKTSFYLCKRYYPSMEF